MGLDLSTIVKGLKNITKPRRSCLYLLGLSRRTGVKRLRRFKMIFAISDNKEYLEFDCLLLVTLATTIQELQQNLQQTLANILMLLRKKIIL